MKPEQGQRFATVFAVRSGYRWQHRPRESGDQRSVARIGGLHVTSSASGASGVRLYHYVSGLGVPDLKQQLAVRGCVRAATYGTNMVKCDLVHMRVTSEVRRNIAANIRFTFEANINPFDFSSDEAVCDVKCHSCIELTDFEDHLVGGTSFATREELKAYKLMDAHNYVTSGRVQQHQVRDLGYGHRVVVGKVTGFPCSVLGRSFFHRGGVASRSKNM
ncbi:hypothetical protein HPB51_004711 [Rhipicephalus microplus]|uniref:Uncharacterized protein n=1 Tax=Rhipicephalus microplus TaxID=6941 RepID=A0A9J6DYP8_RHIMP|nr:hypothetical protein HPB51_004711 [Rhipicephalus microplus]